MPLFDAYIAIDFSGSTDAARQKASIVFAEAERGSLPHIEKDRFTRFEVVIYLVQRLLRFNSNGKRVLCGFDFCYAFPQGFWNALTGRQEHWANMIRDLANGIPNIPAISDKPESNARYWAHVANQNIARKVKTGIGPFWGPNSSQATDPHFPFWKAPFNEYRLVEKPSYGFKPIFKIGGQGAVGLQSLCGIPYLYHLRTTCSQQNVPLHSWPFDGWDTPGPAHVLVEWYPAIYNTGPKSHESDALACVNWAHDMDDEGNLADYLAPTLSDSEKAQANIEGWVLGVS